jgi:serine phosphatase RsbU (regulator of sigma subunit)
MLEQEDLIREVRADIDRFAAGMEQYDDITMLALKMA